MKNLGKLQIFNILVFILLFITGCERTVTKIVPEYIEHSWTESELLWEHDNIVLNSYVTSSNLFYLLTVDKLGVLNIDEDYITYYLDFWGDPLSTAHQPLINDDVILYRKESSDALCITRTSHNNTDLMYEFQTIELTLDDIDSTKALTFLPEIWDQPFAAVNENNQILTTLEDIESHTKYYLLINYEFADNNEGLILTDIQLEELDFSIAPNIRSLAGIGDRFFMGFYNVGNFIVYPDGEYRQIESSQIPAHVDAFIEYNDNLYAKSLFDAWYKSQDNGESWTYIDHFSFGSAKYTNVDNKIISYNDGIISHVDIENRDSYELDNDGLYRKAITSFNIFNDKVYASTLSGFYYRDLDDFFTYKETDLVLNQDGERLQFVNNTAD